MDLNVSAFRIVQQTVNNQPVKSSRQAASAKGGIVGGKARARSMTKEQRVDVARKASAARWIKAGVAAEQSL